MEMTEKHNANPPPPIQQIDLTKTSGAAFLHCCVGCIVLSQDGKIVLQQRDSASPTYPDCLATFGGGLEPGESPIQALVRELKEELGAQVQESEVISLGAITERATNYSELIYVYFWQDKYGSITGCYEGKAEYYDNCTAAMMHPKIMDDVRWLLRQCQSRQLLKR